MSDQPPQCDHRKTFFLYGMDCPRRRVDTQQVYNYFITNGYRPVPRPGDATHVVVSTCAYSTDRERAAHAYLRKLIASLPSDKTIIATGCLPKINPSLFAKYSRIIQVPPDRMTDLDRLIGPAVPLTAIPQPNIVDEADTEWLQTLRKRSLTTRPAPNPRRYLFNLLIARGCRGRCSFCAIRFAMGTLVSKPLTDILQEFRSGLRQGYTEFLLIAEDSGSYGLDQGTTFVDLLRALFRSPGPYRLGINDLNPQWVIRYARSLIPLMARNTRKLSFCAVPIQSGSNVILKAMRRNYRIEELCGNLATLQKRIPHLPLLTHLMVGFPGETDTDFEQTLALLTRIRFAQVDVFEYTDRPHTVASCLPNKIPPQLIRRRALKLRQAVARHCGIPQKP